MENAIDYVLGAMCIVLVGSVGLLGLLAVDLGLAAFYPQTTYVNCYRVTAPFGVFGLDGHFFFGSGAINTEEVYSIKYFENGELKTLILDAEETPIIIDGTFRLERRYSRGPIFGSEIHVSYRLHLPFLPEINQTMTTEWE